MDTSPTFRRTNPTFYFLLFFFAAWIACWLFKIFLTDKNSWLDTDEGAFLYWIVAKLLVWILPSIVFIRIIGKQFRDILGLKNFVKTFLLGGVFGLVIVGINVLAKTVLYHKPILFDKTFFPFLSAVLISPIIEEITFRGAVLKGFFTTYGSKTAQILTAFFFILIHMPGWYFQGDLLGHFTSPHVVTILLLGLAFGFIMVRSNSIIGSIVAHFLNNLTS